MSLSELFVSQQLNINYLSNAIVNLNVPKFRFRLKAELATISVQSRVIRITETYTVNNCYRTVTSTDIFPLIPVTNAMCEAVSLSDGQNFPVICSPNLITAYTTARHVSLFLFVILNKMLVAYVEKLFTPGSNKILSSHSFLDSALEPKCFFVICYHLQLREFFDA